MTTTKLTREKLLGRLAAAKLRREMFPKDAGYAEEVIATYKLALVGLATEQSGAIEALKKYKESGMWIDDGNFDGCCEALAKYAELTVEGK